MLFIHYRHNIIYTEIDKHTYHYSSVNKWGGRIWIHVSNQGSQNLWDGPNFAPDQS